MDYRINASQSFLGSHCFWLHGLNTVCNSYILYIFMAQGQLIPTSHCLSISLCLPFIPVSLLASISIFQDRVSFVVLKLKRALLITWIVITFCLDNKGITSLLFFPSSLSLSFHPSTFDSHFSLFLCNRGGCLIDQKSFEGETEGG